MELGAAAQTKKPTSVVILQAPDAEKLSEKYEKLFEKIKNANPYI
jgi:H/ACA ribonucleoprotein complex subunit 2